MKMGCLPFTGAFWGILLILIGVLIIVKIIFHVHIPIFRIFFALLLIYAGIQLLVGGFWFPPRDTVLFSEPVAGYSAPSGEQRIVFGRGVVDLSGVSVAQGPVKRNISVVFGSGLVRIDPSVPAIVMVSSAFASARMPDGNLIAFGNYTYRTPAFREGANHLTVHASVAFGELVLQENR